MRHRVAGYKLGRNTEQRAALWRSLITELLRHDRIQTTEAKARSMRGAAEHLISVAKRGLAEGGNAVHARRQVERVVYDSTVAKRLFDEIAPLYASRPGGYTRMIKVGPRMGDGAEMVILELVEKPEKSEPGEKAAKKPEKKSEE